MVLRAIRADSSKTGRAENQNLLHRKADRSSKYVEIHVVKKIYVEFGYSNASYQFWVRLRDGHIAREDVSRRLRAQIAKVSVRHQPPSNLNSDPSGFGRRGEQKGGNGVQILTAAGVHGNSCWLDGQSVRVSIKRNLKCFNVVFGKTQCRCSERPAHRFDWICTQGA